MDKLKEVLSRGVGMAKGGAKGVGKLGKKGITSIADRYKEQARFKRDQEQKNIKDNLGFNSKQEWWDSMSEEDKQMSTPLYTKVIRKLLGDKNK